MTSDTSSPTVPERNAALLDHILDSGDGAATALIDASNPDRTLIVTYDDLRERVAAASRALHGAGIGAGDRIGVVGANTTTSVVAILAAMTHGRIAVVLDPAATTFEMADHLAEVDASILLTDRALDIDTTVSVATIPDADIDGVDALPAGSVQPTGTSGPHDCALMLFTSGTAGSPKAAMLSHRNLTSNQEAIIDTGGSGMSGDSVVLATIPISHMYGLNISLLATLRVGGTVVLAEGFHPLRSVELIAEHGIDRLAGVPPMWRSYLDTPGIRDDAFAGIARLASGASALHPTLWQEFADRFGVEIQEGYGLTETSPTVTSHIGIPVRPGTVGQPVPGVEVKVVDYDGLAVPVDDSGEILVRGPGVFMGYWNNEEATKAVLDDDGWLRTRDIGVFSEDGYLALVDRAKDLIIVSGFNVYPFEVETVLVQHPQIEATVVIGRDDDRRGERVVAFVTVPDGQTAPELDDVIDFCRERLARYKCPSEIEVVDELPIGSSGKVQRRKLS